MSKLNRKSVHYVAVPLARSENGNMQFVKDAAARLFEHLVSSFYVDEKNRNKSAADMLNLIRSAVAQDKHQAVANMIVFAKNDMGMRTMPIVAAVHLINDCRQANVKDLAARKLISDVIVRADELCDVYAYALSVFGSKNKIPLAIKRGVEDAFNKFGQYDLAKYNRNADLKLSDLLRIVHPTPEVAEMGRVYKQIIDGTLEAPYTWEVEFSRNGQLNAYEQKPKAILWKEILSRNSLGFLAAIRNIRNMSEAGVDNNTQRMLAGVISKGHRKVLPFQIFQAYKMTPQNMVSVRDALVDAVEKSVANVPVVGEAVWMVGDVSGSMQNKVGESDMSMLSTSAQLAATAIKSQLLAGKRVAFTAFATRALTMEFSRHDTILSIAEKIERLSNQLGGSTNLNSALAEYSAVVRMLGQKPDAFMVFSDMQVNDRGMFADGWQSVKPANLPREITSIPLKVAVNFRSMETTPFSKLDGFVQLSGFSERIFQLLTYLRDYDKIYARLAV